MFKKMRKAVVFTAVLALVLMFGAISAQAVEAGSDWQLRQAIADAGTVPTTIMLTQSFSLESAVNIPSEANITLVTSNPFGVELIRAEGAGRHFTVNGALTIGASGNVAQSRITLTSNLGPAGNRGGVNVEGGVGGSSVFTIFDGVVISGNRNAVGGGVAVGGTTAGNRGHFIMNGGEISDNITTGNGSGVARINSGFFTMNGGRIINNTAQGANGGGGIHTGSGMTGFGLILNGGAITGNSSTQAPSASAMHILTPVTATIGGINGEVIISGSIGGVNGHLPISATGNLIVPSGEVLKCKVEYCAAKF
ncbi:MAG: hypothetical protein FWF77_03835 [Defluviitaleaceae bacterium]|nr:hypothetical protein [Defluviitaleaceae bacterium]